MNYQRTWLPAVQSMLNDAHLTVTDMVAARDGAWLPDEVVLLERIDSAIVLVQTMRQADQTLERPMIVRDTRR